MKNLFKRYFNSILLPDEFSKMSDFVGDSKNKSAIYKLLKPLWDTHIKDSGVNSKSNPELLEKIRKTILIDRHETTKRKLKIYTIGLRVAAVIVIGLLLANVFFFQKSNQNQYAEQIQTINVVIY